MLRIHQAASNPLLERALSTHCIQWTEASRSTAVPNLWDSQVRRVVGARCRFERVGSYLQRPVTLLHARAEFRVHVRFFLPDAHPKFPTADRGMACFVRGIDENGLFGPVIAEVPWLGEPLRLGRTRPRALDWVGALIEKQGYLDIAGAEWRMTLGREVEAAFTVALDWHLEHMSGRGILEERAHAARIAALADAASDEDDEN